MDALRWAFTMATVTSSPSDDTRPASAHAPRRKGRPDDALQIGTRVSSWRVDGELGRGGMASVHAVIHYEVRQARRDQNRAPRRSSATRTRRARSCARRGSSTRVDHPAVIDVFATGSCDGRPYLVMEKLDGHVARHARRSGPAVARGEAIEILLELCDVLRAAHAAGVVHRDLKLDNVFICDEPFADGRRVKLLDWGVALRRGRRRIRSAA